MSENIKRLRDKVQNIRSELEWTDKVIADLEAENAMMREALESAGNVLDGIATATSSIPAFMPILEKIEAALATGSEGK